MKKLFFLLSLILFIFLAFNFEKKEPIQISYYHWKNSFNIKDSKEKLYIKVLDISYSNKLDFIKTTLKEELPKNFIPTVYITNEAMKKVSFSKISQLILEQVKQYNYKELQIDCDWSLKSKANYFSLLKELKKQSNKTLSATIRLHQIKYFSKTGVPPVDYGVLMYYNMSNITDIKTKNSILDNTVAKKYHYNFDIYPLKLKLALPLYNQAVRFRDTKALDIFEGVKEKDFNKNFIQISKNLYQVKQSQYFQKKYIYQGDIFRFEESKKEDIQTALKDFFNLSNNRFNEIIFYRYTYKNRYNLQKLIKETL